MKQSKVDEIVVKKFGVDLNNLESFVKPPTHENNPVTKKDIFEHLNEEQKDQIKFHIGDFGLTWQDLDPRLNRFGSVRYQFIKNSGHYIGEEIKLWKCHQEGCEHFQTEVVVYFVSFGNSKKSACDSVVHPDDTNIVGLKGTTHGHIASAHSDFFVKRLGQMGVTAK